MLEFPGQIHLVAGAISIIIGIFYLKVMSDRRTFRWLTLLGYMVLVVGVMSSGIADVWLGIILFVSWFGLAAYFYCRERKE